MKSIPVSVIAFLVCSLLAGCASGNRKSGIRMYEGDSSPGIRMHQERPGYPLNSL